jgi:signal transduction histidine kinase
MHINILKKSLKIIPGAWFLVNLKNGNLLDCSREFADFMGTTRQILLKKQIQDLSFSGNEQGWGIKKLSLELLKNSARYEDVGLYSLDKVPAIVDIHVSHPKKYRSKLAICLVTDKSHQRQLQGELISKHQELRKAFSELADRTKELETAKRQLELMNKDIGYLSAELRTTASLATIGEIAAELTHQLNNPLAAARGASRKLNRIANSENLNQMQPMLTLLSNALERMRLTIDEVRQVYKNSRMPETSAGAINLKEIIDNTLALLQQKLEGHKIILEIPQNLKMLKGHRSLFQHVIVNLLDNAIESFNKSGILHIAAVETDRKIEISIEDNGPGIPPSMHEKIFDAFFTTKEKGSGLGLAAVKRYVEQDGATINVDYSRYGGAKFTISYNIDDIEPREG